MLALPAINTGVFVYQSFILESKGWGDFVIAKSFMFYAIFSVVTFLPAIAVGARRLHDINRSGWWQLIALTIIGIILLIIWWATV